MQFLLKRKDFLVFADLPSSYFQVTMAQGGRGERHAAELACTTDTVSATDL